MFLHNMCKMELCKKGLLAGKESSFQNPLWFLHVHVWEIKAKNVPLDLVPACSLLHPDSSLIKNRNKYILCTYKWNAFLLLSIFCLVMDIPTGANSLSSIWLCQRKKRSRRPFPLATLTTFRALHSQNCLHQHPRRSQYENGLKETASSHSHLLLLKFFWENTHTLQVFIERVLRIPYVRDS